MGERDGGVGGERCGAPGWWRRGDLPGDLNLVRVRRRRGVVIVLGFPIVVGALGGLLALLLLLLLDGLHVFRVHLVLVGGLQPARRGGEPHTPLQHPHRLQPPRHPLEHRRARAHPAGRWASGDPAVVAPVEGLAAGGEDEDIAGADGREEPVPFALLHRAPGASGAPAARALSRLI